ncbi:hypothetical protein MBLNU13_g02984t1 [Cladosporium sp. NU13]
MFVRYFTTALIIAGSAFAAESSTPSVEPVIIEIGNPNATIATETSSKVVLTDISGRAGPTVFPGSTTGIAIIGDKTYTAGAPAETNGANTINSILTDGIVYNNQTYTYTTTDTRTTPISTVGHTVTFGDGPSSTFSTRSQTVTFVSGPTVTASEISSGVWNVYTATVSVGGSAKEVFGDEVTAASTGVVIPTSSPSASTTSSTSGASKLTTGCWVGLVVCGLLFSLL